MEEMWLKVVNIEKQPVCFLTWSEWDKHKCNVLYSVKLENLDYTQSDECVEMWFFTYKEALELDLFCNVNQFIKMYFLT